MKPIQGLFDVHPSFQNSTLESFVSHGSGAPGLDIVVDKYHDMVGNIYLIVILSNILLCPGFLLYL